MTIADVINRTQFNGYSAPELATVKAALSAIYATPTGQAMIDSFLAIAANSISFTKPATPDASALLNTGKVTYDPAFSTSFYYLNKSGIVVQEVAAGTIAHELVHALKGLDDVPSWKSQTSFAGDTVTYANIIFNELGLDEQLSYPGSGFADVLELNRNYTAGATIDRAWSKDANFPEAGISTPSARTLLIGGASANTLKAGDGADILVGNNGDDVLIGGGGIDTAVFDGNQLDYDVRQNADGSWTVRHTRGAMDEGADTLIDVEKIRFDQGSTFDLKKGALSFQTDFALVIDTTGSMGSSIDAVKTQAASLITAAFNAGKQDARIGVVGFKDTTEGEPSSIIQSFTDSDVFADREAAALAAINSISVGGGGDTPETAFDGLLNALDGAMGDWRTGASVKRIALFTDAPAKDGELAGAVNALASNIGAVITSSLEAAGARGAIGEFVFEFANGRFDPTAPATDIDIPTPTVDVTKTTVQIFTIFTGPDDEDTTDLREVAAANGGDFFTADSDADLVDILFDIIELPPNAIPNVTGPVALPSIAENSDALTLTLTALLAGATDADGDPLFVDSMMASSGTVVRQPDGSFTYQPVADFTGTVTFTYSISDGEATISQSATLDVIAENVLPVARDDIGPALGAGTAVTILAADLIANDVDADGDPLAIVSVGSAVGGLATLDTDGKITFVADANFEGAASFIYQLGDGSGGTGPTTSATVVLEVRKPPIVTDGPDFIIGTPHADDLDALGGNDTIRGLGDNDKLNGGLGDDRVDGGEGDDIVRGGLGDDRAVGGEGDDIVRGGLGDDRAAGGKGDDIVRGGFGDDRVVGGEGDDIVRGGRGGDWVGGGVGDDIVRGDRGNDRIGGGEGDDIVRGGRGKDRVDGGEGDDIVRGGRGDDIIVGGLGNDIVRGGHGDDIFVFGENFGLDRVEDFAHGTDRLRFNDGFFEDVDAVLAAATQVGGDIVIVYDEMNRITLGNFMLADLSADSIRIA